VSAGHRADDERIDLEEDRGQGRNGDLAELKQMEQRFSPAARDLDGGRP
jgi:hypothetical protein